MFGWLVLEDVRLVEKHVGLVREDIRLVVGFVGVRLVGGISGWLGGMSG